MSPVDRERLAEQEAEVLRLEGVLRDTEAAYTEEKPRFDAGRKTYPQVREEETATIRKVGRARDDLQLARAELLCLRGEGPRPRMHIELDGTPIADLRVVLAAQSRAQVGSLDYVE